MSVPPLSKGRLLMTSNEDKTKGLRGALGNPREGGRDDEAKEAPRRTRIPALGSPIGAAARQFLMGAYSFFCFPVGAIYAATEPTSAPSHSSPEKPAPDVDVPVRPQRTGVKTASGVRGLGMGKAAFSKLGMKSPPARGAGSERLHAG